MQISEVSLTLTWPHRLVYSEFSCVRAAATSFPLSKHTGGGDTAPAFSASVFIYSSRGKWVFPLSCGVFLPPSLLQAFPFLVAGRVLPLLPSPARLVYLQFCEGFPSSPFGGTSPSLLHVFIVLIAYYSVSLFFPGWGSVCPGAMLIWPRVVCGSTVYHLAHLVSVFPSRLGMGVWQPGGPPGFSV
jgi:hypothetical protein